MEPTEALTHWDRRGPLRPAPDAGLINHTWLVGEPVSAVLQWVNPIFKPSVHEDIEAVTARLAEAGMITPRLLRPRDGSLCVLDGAACWRMLSFVPGRTFHTMDSPARAAAAGELVGRFHAATAGWDYEFQHRRPGAHDTLAHMSRLADALERGDGHPLAEPVRALGGRILEAWAGWEGALEQPERVGHGDLKLSNLRFDPTGERAVCLLDLDTLASLPLAVEMGDAWRSWCNPAGEDDPEACAFDLNIFEASARAWLGALGGITEAELGALVPGVERICLELSARFAADALANSYFREDRERFPQPGAHNLHRARAQFQLARSVHEKAHLAIAILRSARS